MFRLKLLIAILTVAAFIGGSQRAEAGLRLRVDSGATTLWFYTTSDTNLATGAFNIGAYSANLETTVTNYPGSATIGVMSQTLNIGSVGASPSSISVQSWVVDDSTLGGLTPSGIGEITNAAQIALLSAAAQKEFTAPVTSGLYNVTSDAGSSINASVSSGNVLTTTTVDGTNVLSLVHNVVVGNDGFNTGTVPDAGTPNRYTLTQLLVFSGVNTGATGFNVTGSSSVTAVPAPAGLILAATAVPFIGLLRRRMRKVEPTTAA